MLLLSGCDRSEVTPASLPDEAVARRDEAGPGCATAVLSTPLASAPWSARVAALESKTMRVSPPLAGHVADVRATPGERVVKGDVLVTIRSPDLPSLTFEAESARLVAERKRRLSDATLELFAARATSLGELHRAESEAAEADLLLSRRRALLGLLGATRLDATRYALRAPQSGTLLELDVRPGDRVTPDKVVAVVASLDEVLVVADVPVRDASRVSPSDIARIEAPGLSPRHVKVGALLPAIDPSRDRVPLRLEVENADRALKPNAFVWVTLQRGDEASVVVVPASAVVEDGLSARVGVLGPSGAIASRPVEVGRRENGLAEILAGLEAGEPVVVEGARARAAE